MTERTGADGFDVDDSLEQMAQLVGTEERRTFFERRPQLITAECVKLVCTEVARQVQIDAEKALELAAAARHIAERLDDGPSRALAARAAANAHLVSVVFRLAKRIYGQALDLFLALGADAAADVTR
ncbi:MAG: hypothetical protein AAFY88_04195, partial [Acidobacteriota bacterium]